MRSITLSDGSEWACNQRGEGVFSRRTDGTWQQHIGTCDTPIFRDYRKFSRYVHRRFHAQNRDYLDVPLARMIDKDGWP